MRHHVAVIDPGTRVPELDCFNRISRRSPLPATTHLPALFGLDSLRRVEEDVAGVVILGSGASVHDDHGWVAELRTWLRPRIEAGVPMLGLCFGHQLLADLLGGEVGWRAADRTKRKGLREITLDADPLWGEARRGPVVVSHAEIVTRLPEELVVVGRSEEVEVEAFAHARLPLWGFQSHPEATSAFAANNAVPVDAPDSVYAFGHAIVDRFLDLVAARSADVKTPGRPRS